MKTQEAAWFKETLQYGLAREELLLGIPRIQLTTLERPCLQRKMTDEDEAKQLKQSYPNKG